MSKSVNKTLTRVSLAEELGNAMGISRQEANEYVSGVLEQIADTLSQGEHVKLPNFGNLVLIDKRERPGRNPRNGIPAKVSSRRVVTFRPCQSIRRLVESNVPVEE